MPDLEAETVVNQAFEKENITKDKGYSFVEWLIMCQKFNECY